MGNMNHYDHFGFDHFGSDRFGSDRFGSDRFGFDHFGSDHFGSDRFGSDHFAGSVDFAAFAVRKFDIDQLLAFYKVLRNNTQNLY